MQTLGLSDSTPRTEGRLKSLFWPTIATDNDVDYVTRQGFWICIVVATFTLVLSLLVVASGSLWTEFTAIALLQVVFFFLCGVGIRVISRVAAVAAFSAYLISCISSGRRGFGVLTIIILAMLLANIRATFLAVKLVASRTEPPPAPLSATWSQRFSDVMPRKLWPSGKYAFYAVAVVESALWLSELLPGSRVR